MTSLWKMDLIVDDTRVWFWSTEIVYLQNLSSFPKMLTNESNALICSSFLNLIYRTTVLLNFLSF